MKRQARLEPNAPLEESWPARRPFGADLVLLGLLVIALFLAAFGAWANFVPIESAVVAPGVVSVDSNVRTVQHLEGGIVDAILVREGEEVAAGQVVIRLKNTVPVATLNELQVQHYQSLAAVARLTAERDRLEVIEFPSLLRDRVGDEAAVSAVADQETIFEARRSLGRDQREIVQRKLEGIAAEIEGIASQIDATKRRLVIVEEDLATKKDLAQRNLMERPRVLEVEGEKARLEGEIGKFEAAIGVAWQRKAETELDLAETESQRTSLVVEDLRAATVRAYELRQRLAAAEDVLERTAIRSPIDGVIVDLAVHTEGGVIASGEPLLKVVPTNDQLIVLSTIDPLDIDRVKEGMPATVWLTAANRSTASGITAVVETLSADRLIDPHSGAPYYMARIGLDAASVERNAMPLQAGMGAEVMIRTGARTTWDYLSAPIFRELSRGLREN